jgi:hypothetical protein
MSVRRKSNLEKYERRKIDSVKKELEALGGKLIAKTIGNCELWNIPKESWNKINLITLPNIKFEKVQESPHYNLKVKYT